MYLLHDFLKETSKKCPNNIAVVDSVKKISYKTLFQQAMIIGNYLLTLGIKKGDRVGIFSPKCSEVLAIMQGCLSVGAIYVPIDAFSPDERVLKIINDCGISILFSNQKKCKLVQFGQINFLKHVFIGDLFDEHGIKPLVSNKVEIKNYPILKEKIKKNDIAYIIYTSGSTGTPKGVCITHENATTFAIWAAKTFGINTSDKLANHASFHFDISVLDIYATFYSGATVYLIPERDAYLPSFVKNFLLVNKITIWYSVPSILIMIMEQTSLLTETSNSLHTVLFAGEVFPIQKLKKLKQSWPDKRFYNLFGPTETNVCTYYEVKHFNPEWNVSIPIGKFAADNTGFVLKSNNEAAEIGEVGELYIQGPTVMHGYWGYPPLKTNTYATGDIVKVLPTEDLMYIGRKDHMVKIKGFRIELGEIEAALHAYSGVVDVSVCVQGTGIQKKLCAFIVAPGKLIGLIELKKYLVKKLPKYMLIDRVFQVDELPRTSNGKIDRKALSDVPNLVE